MVFYDFTDSHRKHRKYNGENTALSACPGKDWILVESGRFGESCRHKISDHDRLCYHRICDRSDERVEISYCKLCSPLAKFLVVFMSICVYYVNPFCCLVYRGPMTPCPICPIVRAKALQVLQTWIHILYSHSANERQWDTCRVGYAPLMKPAWQD